MEELNFELNWMIFWRNTYGVRDEPCPLQHCCHNASLDMHGNCIANFEDILECFVDKDDMMSAGDPERDEIENDERESYES